MDNLRALADELRAAIPDKDAWFGMSAPTFVAAGRRDGQATVVANSGGWQMVSHPDREPVVELHASAQEAVAAAAAIPAEAPVPAGVL